MGVKWPGRGVDHPSLSSAATVNGLGLYLCFPPVPIEVYDGLLMMLMICDDDDVDTKGHTGHKQQPINGPTKRPHNYDLIKFSFIGR